MHGHRIHVGVDAFGADRLDRALDDRLVVVVRVAVIEDAQLAQLRGWDEARVTTDQIAAIMGMARHFEEGVLRLLEMDAHDATLVCWLVRRDLTQASAVGRWTRRSRPIFIDDSGVRLGC